MQRTKHHFGCIISLSGVSGSQGESRINHSGGRKNIKTDLAEEKRERKFILQIQGRPDQLI